MGQWESIFVKTERPRHQNDATAIVGVLCVNVDWRRIFFDQFTCKAFKRRKCRVGGWDSRVGGSSRNNRDTNTRPPSAQNCRAKRKKLALHWLSGCFTGRSFFLAGIEEEKRWAGGVRAAISSSGAADKPIQGDRDSRTTARKG